MNANIIEIGKFEEQRNGYKHPYWVYIDLSNESAPIAVAEGTGYHGVGCNLTSEQILSSDWEDHINKCGCSNLINIIKTLISGGQRITPQAIKEKWFGQKNI